MMVRRLYSERDVRMNTNQNNIGIGFWLAWVLASAIGFGLGAIAGIVILYAARVPEGPAFPILFGIIFGTVGGFAQWLILRRQIPESGLWIPFSALGFMMAVATAASIHRSESTDAAEQNAPCHMWCTIRKRNMDMNIRSVAPVYLCLIMLALTACATKSIPTQPPQSPDEYLSNALDWIETNSVKIDTVDWVTVREQALALAPNPQTTTDTYPALEYAVTQLGDSATVFITPDEWNETRSDPGFDAYYPEAVILSVYPNRPAERAGLRVGDVIEAINGKPPQQWLGTPYLDFFLAGITHEITVRRAGEDQPITVTVKLGTWDDRLQQPTGRRISTDHGNIGYIELLATGGWDQYPTIAQQVIRKADRAGTCGWIVDLRRNNGGDIWSYIAAVGPILGEGKVGGFAYLNGARDLWKYEDGKVFWGEAQRYREDLVEGRLYKLKRPMPPVAVLTSRATMAAGELAVVIFQGRSQVRTFGEATGGSPFLQNHTGLSDGAYLSVSGAYSQDRTGRIYKGSITPDEIVTIDWKQFGADQDPVILAAQNWLLSQSDCAQK